MKHYGPMERPWALFDVNNMLWKMVSWLTLKRIMTPAFLTCYWQKSAQRVFLSIHKLSTRCPTTRAPPWKGIFNPDLEYELSSWTDRPTWTVKLKCWVCLFNLKVSTQSWVKIVSWQFVSYGCFISFRARERMNPKKPVLHAPSHITCVKKVWHAILGFLWFILLCWNQVFVDID